MILFYHLDEWVVGCAETVVAYGWEVCDFGTRAVDVGLWACGRHSCFSCIIIVVGEVLVAVEGRKERRGVAVVVVVVAGVLLLLGALCQAFDKKKDDGGGFACLLVC